MVTRLAQLIYPPACVLCGRRLAEPSRVLCPACDRVCPTLLPPVCRCCGVPLPGAYDLMTTCRRCAASPPHFASARAPFRYQDALRQAVQHFKYRGHHRLGAWFADAMLRTAAASFPLAHLTAVTATPLHWVKRRLRGWNPSEALAERLARALGVPYHRRALTRIRWTATQTRLTPAQRQRNVRHAFCAVPSLVRDASLLLVDDVLTTGATADACAAALKEAGALEVFVITAARADRP